MTTAEIRRQEELDKKTVFKEALRLKKSTKQFRIALNLVCKELLIDNNPADIIACLDVRLFEHFDALIESGLSYRKYLKREMLTPTEAKDLIKESNFSGFSFYG